MVAKGKVTTYLLAIVLMQLLVSPALTTTGYETKLKWLDKEEYFSLLSTSEYSLVLFSTSWCSHCKDFYPVLERVQEVVPKGHQVAVGVMDCSKRRAEWCSETEAVRGYPALRLYYNGHFAEYRGIRQLSELGEWLEDRLLHAWEPFDAAAVTRLKSKGQDVFVAFVNSGSENEQIFKTFATVTPTAHFYYTHTPEIAKQYFLDGVSEDIVFLKNHDEGKVLYSSEFAKPAVDSLAYFYSKHENPYVFEFDSKFLDKVEKEKKSAIIMFVSDYDHEESIAFQQLAMNFANNPEVLFSRTALLLDNPTTPFLIRTTGITPVDFPAYRMLDLRSGRTLVSKHKINSREHILKLMNDYYYSGNPLTEYKRASTQTKLKKMSENRHLEFIGASGLSQLTKSGKPFVLFVTEDQIVCPQCAQVERELATQKKLLPQQTLFVVDKVKDEVTEWSLPKAPSMLCFSSAEDVHEWSGLTLKGNAKWEEFLAWVQSCLASAVKVDL